MSETERAYSGEGGNVCPSCTTQVQNNNNIHIFSHSLVKKHEQRTALAVTVVEGLQSSLCLLWGAETHGAVALCVCVMCVFIHVFV